MNKIVIAAALVVLSGITAQALYHAGGLVEFIVALVQAPEGRQVFADLLITMCLLLVFMKRDAEQTGRTFLPWAVLSLLIGSFGPMVYFLTAKKKPSALSP